MTQIAHSFGATAGPSGGLPVRGRNLPTDSAVLETALVHVESAIRLLDSVDAPSDIAAHLDLGRHRLTAELERIGEGDEKGDGVD